MHTKQEKPTYDKLTQVEELYIFGSRRSSRWRSIALWASLKLWYGPPRPGYEIPDGRAWCNMCIPNRTLDEPKYVTQRKGYTLMLMMSVTVGRTRTQRWWTMPLAAFVQMLHAPLLTWKVEQVSSMSPSKMDRDQKPLSPTIKLAIVHMT